MMGFQSPDSSRDSDLQTTVIKYPRLKRSNAQKRILLVDDVEDIRIMLRFTISKVFPQVQITDAHSGMAASVELVKSHFDLVVSDVDMPNGDGIWLHFFMEQYHTNTPLVFFACSPEHILLAARSRKAFAKTDANGLLSELLALWGADET